MSQTTTATTTTTSTSASTEVTCSFTLNAGKICTGTTLQEYAGVTADACKAYCVQRPDCDGVNFLASTGYCKLKVLGSFSSSATIDWYEKTCA